MKFNTNAFAHKILPTVFERKQDCENCEPKILDPPSVPSSVKREIFM